MKVSYKDVKGELVKLEKNTSIKTLVMQASASIVMQASASMSCFCGAKHDESTSEVVVPQAYDLTIYDEDKKATVSFEAIDPRDIRFICASVMIQ